ncbi:hypothetical protein ABIE44_000561 [Marmoricola sp. OAE513]|uniref:beta strand repeat-containing protein n=1 Tax=Marmoricola sp. OAE513 TaxID=2817894 RepID=UPI001AE6F4FB
MRNPMRKLTAAVAALGVGLGLTLVAASSVQAATSTPTNNQVVRGNFAITTSALGDGSLCINGNASRTTHRLINAANVTVFSSAQSNAVNGFTTTLTSQNYPNGAYTVRSEEQRRSGTIICSTSNTTINTPIVIDNITDIVFNSPPSSGAQNTSVPVSATLTDPNAANPAVAGATVTFALGGGTSVNATTNASGVATANLPLNGAPRTTTISASFAATSFLKGSSTSRQFDVTKNSTSTTLAQPATVVHGQSTSFSATVASTNGLATAPTGTVQFTVDGNNFGAPVALSGGTANSVSTSSLSTGNHTIGAVYSGSSDHLGSSAATKTQVVNKAETTTTITDTPSGSTVSGQAVTFKAHVDIVSPGVGTLAGGVQFYVDNDPFGTAVPLGAGDNAQVTISNLTVANHDVYAVYNGNADFAASSSATLTHGVGKADTTLDLTSSANPAFSGQPITYTAVVAPVAPGAGNPTGAVQFAIDGVNLGSPVNLVGGQAVSPVANLQVTSDFSPHVITANYVGDDNFSGQTDSLNQAINPALTTTSLSASPSPSVFGQAVTLHAEVTPNAPATGNPEGFIAFYVDGAAAPAAFVATSGGEADFTTSSLAVGAHTFKAVYSSTDLNFFTSASAVVNHDVNKAATKTVVTSSAQPAVFGQPITFTANVSVLAPGAGAPSGTIVFKDGATTIGSEPVSASTGEQASITVSNLSVGSHAITATYSGDDSFNGSVGNTAQTVTRAQTTTSITSSQNPAANGEGVQFTATVSPVAPGAGVPTGTVRFFVNGANLGGSYPLVDGVVTSPNFASLTPGTYTITTNYQGDANFVGSSGVLAQGTGQNITKGNTSLTVVSGPSPSAYGDTVTVTTTVKSVAPATGKPTGVVQIWEGDELVGATSLVQQSAANTSVATFTTAGLSAGTHALTAKYVGNFNFNGQTGSTTQVVGQIPTVTGITSANNPAVYGDVVNLTATVNTSAGTPTGTVTFKEGSTVLGTAPVGDGGQAVLAVADLHAGSHAIKATYSGDVSHGASTSAALNQVITKAPTKVLAGDVNRPGDVPLRQGWIRAKLVDRYGNPLAGRSISFDAPPGAARPGRHLCDALTNAQGIAECDTQVISIDLGLDLGNESLLDIHGTYNVTYAGDADTIGDTDQGYQY